MAPPDLRESLSDLIMRRKLAGGEFSYVYVPSDEEILGKKAVYKIMQKDVEVFEDFKESNKLPGETDLAFNSRALKLITSLPFEDEKEVVIPKKVATPPPVRKPVMAPSPEKAWKTSGVKTILSSPGPKKELMSNA